MIGDGCYWWKRWFLYIRLWQISDVDNDMIMWVRLLGVPCHAWSVEFFMIVASVLGICVCVDDDTKAGRSMDIARVLIRVPIDFSLPSVLNISIDETKFLLMLREDTFGPARIIYNKDKEKCVGSTISEYDESESAPKRWNSEEEDYLNVEDQLHESQS